VPSDKMSTSSPYHAESTLVVKNVMQPLEKQGNLELVTIYEISKILGSSLDLCKTMREVLNVLSSHMHMRRCMIALVQDSGDVHIIGASGLTQDEI